MGVVFRMLLSFFKSHPELIAEVAALVVAHLKAEAAKVPQPTAPPAK